MTRELMDLLAGATILEAGRADFGGEEWPILRIRTKNGRRFQVFVQRDEEGNGPGHLEAEEVA